MRLAVLCLGLWSVGMISASAKAAETPSDPAHFLARNSAPEAAIVVGQDANPFQRWVATEIQRYIRDLTTATLPIVTSEGLADTESLIVLGDPNSNALAAEAEQQHLTRFEGLKPDGFVIKSAELDGKSILVVGGNDDTGTMYAAYELLERLGIVFQLTGDIVPRSKTDLPLPQLDVRMEPAFKDRGMHCWHGIRWYMGLDEIRKEIDQLAKLKMNVFQFYWGMGGPWVEFSYDNKVAPISGTPESGYVAWPGASGTANTVTVGRECFPENGYMGPPEFAKVTSQEEAYRTAREFLREVIRYAHSRKVQVWLTMGEIPFVPTELAPATSKTGQKFYCGVALSPADPAVLDIWEAALQSMVETYPEADRCWVVSGSELIQSTRPVHGMTADDPQIKALIAEYEHLRPLLPPKSEAAANLGLADLDLADIAIADKLVRRVKLRHPEARLGVALIFRGGQLRALDSALPKDVSLMNMVNFAGETDMSYFEGIRDRNMVVWPRITDDGCELNIQLNATMYDHDETIGDGVKYGLTGVLGQLNKSRGAEQSAQYIAEGAWNPAIDSRTFYDHYLQRLYGPDALEPLLKAFLLLEENEKALGWHGRRGILSTWSASSRFGLTLRNVDYKNVSIDRAAVEKAVQTAVEDKAFWEERATACNEALDLMTEARPRVWLGSQEELTYVMYKTQNLITAFKLLSASRDAGAVFDRALLVWPGPETDACLEQCRVALNQADQLARETAQQMLPYATNPSERHILWIFNKALPTYEVARSYLNEVIAYRNANH